MIDCTGTSGNRLKETEDSEIIEFDESLNAFITDPSVDLPVTTFNEVWGYVLAGQEAALTRGLPITDVGYFGAEVDMYGSLTSVPRRQNLSGYTGRVHLVVTCQSNSLTHFTLAPESKERRELIADLIAATGNFDGLQIDFENIPPRDGEAFLSFLRELQAGLRGKIFTVALYARTRKLSNDVYDYETIKPYVDKIFVMAYDEHWGGGTAGPVASLQWCRRVAEYSLSAIGREKLVMGIPFYGRAWANQNHHRALIFSTTERLINTMNVGEVGRENGISTFNYDVNVSVKVYYEDEYSISAKMEMYKSMNINSIGFWRIGQETQNVWRILKVEQ
ncbi:MAG: glycoside hydrolase [Treponema sp.]|jgi:spore germination protein YaaH|nr:glycoside hydrolase [Treponema sp.]